MATKLTNVNVLYLDYLDLRYGADKENPKMVDRAKSMEDIQNADIVIYTSPSGKVQEWKNRYRSGDNVFSNGNSDESQVHKLEKLLKEAQTTIEELSEKLKGAIIKL